MTDRSKSSRGRDGKTLIELLVVIVTMSAILSTAGQLLYRLSKTERAVRDAGAIARAEIRLYRSFRADAHAADSARPGEIEGQQALVFSSANGSVTYRATDKGVLRSTDGDGTTLCEIYRLGATDTFFRVEDDRFTALTVKPRRQTTGRAKAAAGEFEVVAVLGRIASATGSEDAVPKNEPVEAPQPDEEGQP